jgi:hypothetical protein
MDEMLGIDRAPMEFFGRRNLSGCDTLFSGDGSSLELAGS